MVLHLALLRSSRAAIVTPLPMGLLANALGAAEGRDISYLANSASE